MKYFLCNVILLIGITLVACSQAVQPTSQFNPLPTTAQTISVIPTPLNCTPIIVTKIVSPTPMPTQEMTPCISYNQARIYESVSGDCSKEECLFGTEFAGEGNYPVGVATIEGYYVQVERVGFGDIREVCDSFVIVGGSQGIIGSVLNLVDYGNTVYSKNELNQPVINLDLDALDELDASKILASVQKEPIELIVLAHAARHMGASTCYTRFEILKVKDVVR